MAKFVFAMDSADDVGIDLVEGALQSYFTAFLGRLRFAIATSCPGLPAVHSERYRRTILRNVTGESPADTYEALIGREDSLISKLTHAALNKESANRAQEQPDAVIVHHDDVSLTGVVP